MKLRFTDVRTLTGFTDQEERPSRGSFKVLGMKIDQHPLYPLDCNDACILWG